MFPLPNDTQQRAIAYAPKPLAALSFLSGCYVIHHILVQKPEKLKRMYHRLVLVMNICVMIYAITDFIGTWAMPVGTPYRIGAAGNQATCTAQGFISSVFYLTVPYYYSSLSIYSCFAVLNSFKEEKYRHIEKWLHFGAICTSLPIVIFFAAREGINPSVVVCRPQEYPFGCDKDPNVPCQRGGDDLSTVFFNIYGGIYISITLIIPPAALLFLYVSIKKANRDTNKNVGKKKVIDKFRKAALKDLSAQSGLYLLSFWSTQIVNYSHFVYDISTGKFSYDLAIAATSFSSIQGVVLMLVYFRLEAKKDVPLGVILGGHQDASFKVNTTVESIREAAKNGGQRRRKSAASSTSSGRRYSFHIFDGEADESSPWAQFLNPDDDSKDDVMDSSPDIKEEITSETNDDSPL
uniref:G-protein coupled receptors family 1 profile domain-containing protein n=1 Tax=Ditylum brightwellii TaxID=49249 RepID=A0A7S1Z7N8_9STRA